MNIKEACVGLSSSCRHEPSDLAEQLYLVDNSIAMIMIE